MNYYREFDHNGLLLAEYQAKIFEKSVSKFACSSPIFLRRFVKSDLLDRLDENESSLIDMNVNMALQDIENQFGKSNYGKIKYSEEIMFWMGYIYRYISYTRDISTKIIFKYFKPKQLKENYYVYHTQSEEWVIERMLEVNGLSEDIFDPNVRIKELLLNDSITSLYRKTQK